MPASTSSTSWNRAGAAAALVAGLVLAAAGARALRVRAMDHYLATQRYEDIYYVPPPQWLPVVSLGHDEALADVLWMRALVYFGEELKHRGQVAHAYDYAEAMLALDPDFKPVYHWAATAGIYRTGEVTVDDLRRAAAFLERGARRFPDDGELAWDLGATLAYELAPHLDDPDERAEVRRRAVEHFVVAAREGAGPPWLALQNATQLQRLGKTENAVRHLQEMIATARDPEVKRQLALRLEQLQKQAYAEAFERTARELEARRQRDYPWMPPGLYLHVGPRPVVDEARLLRDGFVPSPESRPALGAGDTGATPPDAP